MLSKMAQPNAVGGGGGGSSSTAASTGRRIPMSLSGAAGSGSTVSRLQQQSASSNGRSRSPQNSNTVKKTESNVMSGPFVAIKKSSTIQQRSHSNSTTTSTSSSSSAAKNDEKKSQNGSSKPSNGNQKSQNGSSTSTSVKEPQKTKEQESEKKEPVQIEVKDEAKEIKSNTKPVTASPGAEPKNIEVAPKAAVNDSEADCAITEVFNTPTAERKSSRRLAGSSSSLEKSPIKPQESPSPVSKKQAEKAKEKSEVVEKAVAKSEVGEKAVAKSEVGEKAVAKSEVAGKAKEKSEVADDVEMESLTVDASPIRAVASVQPTATSTPGRNLFGFRSNSKQVTEVELAAQPSGSPVTTPARSYAQISGRRSIRPTAALTPSKLGSYRCVNTDLDTSNCTNTSMNATVGSEIPNSSSFSFSFFGRGRKRERTPPPLTGSQSANDLAQDVEMSPPKRARFELFSLNLASPFTMLRSRFSKTSISTPSSRKRHEQTPPTGDDEEVSEVQNVSGVINQEEEQQQLNKSFASNEISEAQEAGLETPKKSGAEGEKHVQNEQEGEDQDEDAVANLPATDEEGPVEGTGSNTSRCAIM